MAQKEQQSKSIVNRQARHNYHILEKYTAGIELKGSEVKSLRQGKVQITEAFCHLKNGEVFLHNLHISPYEQGGYANHDPLRKRKLLLTKKEIAQIEKKLRDQSTTMVPLKIFFNDRNIAKVEIAVVKGKKYHDKRQDLKEKQVKRDMQRYVR